jgi:cytoskeletal protein CcmA (bactofilin family)
MTIVLSIMVCFVVFSLGTVWVGISLHQLNSSGREKQRETARNAAEAGLNAAMSRLTADPFWTGVTGQQLPGAEFEVEVNADAALYNPEDPNRYIIAKGYAPSKASPNRVAKRLEQQIQLIPTNAFSHALFSSPGGISGVNKPTVTGDVYSATDLTMSNNATVSGDVTSMGSVTTSNNTSIAGDVRAVGDVTLNNSHSTVLGNVYSGGDVAMTGRVKGSVQAAGSITNNGTIDGSAAAYSPPEPPSAQTLPTFTWDPDLYPAGTVQPDYATPDAFHTYWVANKGNFSGVHRVHCPLIGTCPAVEFGNTPGSPGQWTLSGDTTIVADGPVLISRDITATSPVTLTVVSLATSGDAIKMTTQVTIPDNVKVVFFAPDALVRFVNLKHFSGTVYANSIQLDQQFQLTYVPITVPGFEFGVSSSSHFQIQAGAFKEVPFS